MKRRVLLSVVVGTSLLIVAGGALELRRLRVKPLPTTELHTGVGHFAKSGYALLPETEVTAYAKLFSPDGKTDVRSWEPRVGDIENLEANLFQISALSQNTAGSTRHIDKPDRYFRQYLGIVQGGKKWVFINAFCWTSTDNSDESRQHLELGDDGGKCFWQAWYDPDTQRFSNLMINGEA
jgi:hypothetical protein